MILVFFLGETEQFFHQLDLKPFKVQYLLNNAITWKLKKSNLECDKNSNCVRYQSNGLFIYEVYDGEGGREGHEIWSNFTEDDCGWFLGRGSFCLTHRGPHLQRAIPFFPSDVSFLTFFFFWLLTFTLFLSWNFCS